MTLEQAEKQAQRIANETRCSVLVYRAKHQPSKELSYGTAFSQPLFAVSITRFYPEVIL